jgi:Protein of unknown function (DUF1326)
MAWHISGKSTELCSCKMMCPCWLGPEGEPDQEWCSAAFGFEIEKGQSDGVDLSGCGRSGRPRLTVEVQHLLKPRSVYRDPTLMRRVFAKMAGA